jgi:hypothetical protein
MIRRHLRRWRLIDVVASFTQDATWKFTRQGLVQLRINLSFDRFRNRARGALGSRSTPAARRSLNSAWWLSGKAPCTTQRTLRDGFIEWHVGRIIDNADLVVFLAGWCLSNNPPFLELTNHSWAW